MMKKCAKVSLIYQDDYYYPKERVATVESELYPGVIYYDYDKPEAVSN